MNNILKLFLTLLSLIISSNAASDGDLSLIIPPGATESYVTTEWLSPTTGSVISNIINLNVSAFSTVAPIQRVEYYIDGVLFKTIYSQPTSPIGLSIKR